MLGTYDVARTAVALAVAAAPDELAVVLCVEIGDGDAGAAIELDDLVGGVESTAAVDVSGAGTLLIVCLCGQPLEGEMYIYV